MRTDIECLACFLKQALATAKVCTQDADQQRRVINEVGSLLTDLDTTLSPPENAVAVYGKIAEVTGIKDPYAALKKKENAFALGLREQINRRVNRSEDPLYRAVRYAIAANIIDYGTQQSFDALTRLEACLTGDLPVDDFETLVEVIAERGNPKVLYLADNCGEIVFDGLLVEQLLQRGCRVTLAVRGDAILNDATMADVVACGMDSLCPVITSGTGCPGTPVSSCSAELQEVFAGADIIISKGQGNFETLSDTDAPVFFLLTVKCQVVARHVSNMCGLANNRVTGKGEMILMQGGRK